ncbi:MAG: epoxyqueuosine reductase QueH [Treponema sp.]|nr:epoxyqueuosine reductase QueH [Treponema sp.]
MNYQKELEKIIAQIEEEKKTTVSFIKPTLLLHACCGPCSSYVIEYLAQIFDITIYYYNPNIHPKEEYFRRLEELKKFLERFPQATQNSVKLVEDSYNPEEYFKATNVRQEVELQSEPEKGERCRRCYLFRMKRAWEYACKNNFDWFTTTLSISPHKDSEKINVIGRELEEQKTNDSSAITIHTKFLPSDFKKKGGFLRSTQLSEEYGLWRQDYCGCVFSMRNGKKDL